MAHTVLRLASLVTILALSLAKKDPSRWSRQISTYTSDMSDWVPLTGPIEREPITQPQIKRQAIAEPRILTEPFSGLSRPTGFSQDTFPSRTYYNSPSNRQLYLQSMPSVPSAPQNYLTDQGFGQSIRFGLSPSNYPLSQGFITPQFGYETIPQIKARPQTIPSSPVKFESFQSPVPHQLPISPQGKPFNNHIPILKPEVPKLVDGYRAENITNEFGYNQKKKPQSLQKIKFDNFEKTPKSESNSQNNPKLEREEVQLLYVPLESLNRGQFNFRSPTTSELINAELYSQGMQKPNPQKQSSGADFQRPLQKPVDNFSPQDYFSNFNEQLKDLEQIPALPTTPLTTLPPITAKPKKLKPHQPPLAIFLTEEASRSNQIKVGDVLSSLKTANTIAVLDAVNPLNAPKVFIGPSNLQSPEKYVKFELPYLSNIDNSDKKLRQLPFFVAPLSYNTPQGFAKIPFPSPHVGSVVINSQVKETTQSVEGPSTANMKPNYYVGSYKQEQIPVTQKPSINFYSTVAPKATTPSNYKANYYSFKPQMVSSLRTTKQPEAVTATLKTGSYFLSNVGDRYNPSQFVDYTPQDNYKVLEPVKTTISPNYYSNVPSKLTETTTTISTTITTTAKPESTYSSQLLETHNPYSINQAFHFSTPLDYHNYFDEYKENYASQGSTEQNPPITPSTTTTSTTTSTTPKPSLELVTENQKYQQQTPATYLQNYTPEIHYESEVQNSRYPAYNPNDYTPKTESTPEQTYGSDPTNTDYSGNLPINNISPTEYNEKQDAQAPVINENLTENIEHLPTISDIDSPSRYEYNHYENSYGSSESKTTTTTTSTTTRRPLRSRGRPRYTTSRPESNESTTRTFITRRPLRERRPLQNRPRYEPNKITTERPTRKPVDYSESGTKSTRTRTRGRVHYKPSENEDIYDRRLKSHSKEQDLAYQRDVLHQNYPVTLMERTSTVDIEAITEPASKIAYTKDVETITENYDTENAYTNEKASITQRASETEINEDPTLTSKTTVQASYIQKSPSTNNEEYIYQSRSSIAPVDSISYDEIVTEREDDSYPKQTTPVQKEKPEIVSFVTEATSFINEQNVPIYSINNEFSADVLQDETTTATDIEDAKITSQEENHELEEEEENIVQTTPSYNRVRVRPGVIRQYHQASTESSRIKTERKRPTQTVTYRPAYDRRRTTMRIEEIEADLKTKQVHARPEQDYRHPVYQPELSTEPTMTSPSTQEVTTRHGHFRRRRPTYSTTSTEATRRITYEVKNRFRGRRPTEKPTEKHEVQTDASTTTVRSQLYTRYSHRPRLSERYNKKPESQETETEDQDSNYSISRPKYAEVEAGQWSPKISTDSFKPYNPNDITDDQKIPTTEHKSDKDTTQLDIITARNEYDDILISVTPATNSRNNKKIPDIPPTLEALVEQSKVTKSDSSDSMSTFESMLEEVMKSLEEQDEDEYTTNVMKHKGGEIGEIPPERIISSGEINTQKTTIPVQQDFTTVEPTADDSTLVIENDNDRKSRRRGFWKKVKVRPVTTESIEAAESQYYPNTVNMLGQSVNPSKSMHDKSNKHDKSRLSVTTYKPNFQFIKDIFGSDDARLPILDILPNVDIPKLNAKKEQNNKSTTSKEREENKQTTVSSETQTINEVSPGEFDLGTGSPDPTIDDTYYTTTEPASTKADTVDRSDGFSFMDYLFGVTSDGNENHKESKRNETKKTTEAVIEITTQQSKSKIMTTESSYIPEEITDVPTDDEDTESVAEFQEIKKVNHTEKGTDKKIDGITQKPLLKVESSSMSSFMNPSNVVSTSMSTEISHETEICFRGKCIKTLKDVL